MPSESDAAEAERLYGLITSDAQVRAPIRAMCRQLISQAAVPVDRIFRYRIAFRPRCLDKLYPKEAGVTHGGDMYTWWLPRHTGIEDGEAQLIAEWLRGSVVKLVTGENFIWTCQKQDQHLYLGQDGSVEVVHDQYWDPLNHVIDHVLS